MSYNTDHLHTAGKITVYTTLIGVIVFAFVFMLNIGERQIKHADATSTASTTVTVLNTPPAWTASTTEVVESSTTTPTNAGDVVSWTAVGTDSNSEDYWLLICDTNATPSTTSGGAPHCSSGVQWAISGTTTSGAPAIAATTSLDAWQESNNWYGWICDGNAGSPRCNTSFTQGTNATNSSPFNINHRPVFSAVSDPLSGDPGQTVTVTTTSYDDDTVTTDDQVYLTVCSIAGFSTTTNTCSGIGALTLATSTVYVNDNASASYTIIIPTQDTDYTIYPYIIDTHGFEALGGEQGQPVTLTVNNVAPTVGAATIALAQATTTHIVLTAEAGETTGFTLSFTTSDNNSCDSVIGVPVGDEIDNFDLALYRSGITAAGCLATSTFNANNCYPSGVAPTAWNLVCTASTTSCTGTQDIDMVWNCTFPMWYIADATDASAFYSGQNWLAQVRARDDDTLYGPYSESTGDIDVTSFLAFALNTPEIPYGSLEPGQKNTFLTATTTIRSTGNVGVDKDVQGSSMCTGYSVASPCLPSASSTIPESEQVFATSTVTYDSAEALGSTLSSTTPKEIEINVPKPTSTSTQSTRDAFWGIRVPGTITYAGAYKGQNIFTAIMSEIAEW